jgi:post-segregation antitoxin (ccd killing protein)
MNEPAVHSHPSTEKVAVSVQLDPDLLEQLKHLTNDPSKVIEVAIDSGSEIKVVGRMNWLDVEA